MMRRILFQVSVAFLAQCALAQTAQPDLPCTYTGEILRDAAGKTIRLSSKQMKDRATHRVDIDSGFMKILDFKATFVLEVLVGPTGRVVCAKRVVGLAVADAEVEKAVRQWRFKTAEQQGKPFATLGLMEFYLCNINCGAQGMSYTLLE